MTYPERGASYKNNPKWLDEMKRAEGGRVHLTAGAATGEGRLQKAEMQKQKGEGPASKVRADRGRRRAVERAFGGRVKTRADGGSLNTDEGNSLLLTGAEDASQPTPDQTLPPPQTGPQTGVQKLFGVNGPRYQLAPERMLRSALTLPGDVYSGRVPVVDPNTGHTSDQVIQRAQDIAGLAGEGGLPMSGSGALGMAGGKLKSSVKGFDDAVGDVMELIGDSQRANRANLISPDRVGDILQSAGVSSKDLPSFKKQLFDELANYSEGLQPESVKQLKKALEEHDDE